MLPLRQNNPLAPAAYNGLSSIGQQYEDKDFCKLLTVSLTANQQLPNQAVQLDKDADFIWCAVMASYTGQPFGVRFSDSTGLYLSDAYIGSSAFTAPTTGIGVPYVLLPSLFLPAGSAIICDFIEQSGSNNGPISLLFRGQKRFYR